MALLIAAGILSLVTVFAPALLPANSFARLLAALSAPIEPVVKLTGRIDTIETSVVQDLHLGDIETTDAPTESTMGQRIHVPPTSLASDQLYLILSADGMFLMVREDLGADEVCIRDVEYRFALKAHDKTESGSKPMSKAAAPEREFCIPKHDIGIPEGAGPKRWFPMYKKIFLGSIPRGYAHYSYPFDSIDIQAYSKTILDYYKDGNFLDSKQVPTDMLISVGITGWELSTYDVDSGILTLKRSVFIQLLTPALLIMLYVITLSIILFRPPDLIVEIAIGVLISVWGTRQILLPTDVQAWTLVDMSLLVIYFLVVLIFIIQVPWQAWLLVKGTLPSRDLGRQSMISGDRKYQRHSQVERIMLWLLIPILAYYLVRGSTGSSGKDNKTV